MKIVERSYSGRIFRPRPEIHCDLNGGLCIVATPWGPRQAAKKVINSIVDYFHSTSEDEEVTSPFQKMTCLSAVANNLRVSIMLANDLIYREENRSEYTVGVELFVAAQHEHELVWAQVGGPHLLLDRPTWDLTSLGSPVEHALNYSTSDRLLAPLPSQMLGTASTSNFMVQTLQFQSQDRLILVHRTVIPPRLLAVPRPLRTLQDMSQQMAQQSSDMPFWLGILDL